MLAHATADPDVLRTALIRGAFEYQGQKCSAASRAYVPRSVWRQIKGDLVELTDGLPVGDVTDLSNFMGAVIDERAFAKHKAAIDRARATSHLDVVAGGTYDDSEGWFVRPTVIESSDPTDEMFATEYFGPILSVHVYPDKQYSKVLDQMESFAPYALTGAVIAQDRAVIADATAQAALRRGQLLRQRQADRRGRRAAAVRWRTGIWHQRQGRLRREPPALDVRSLDQGELRPADEPRLPPYGLSPTRLPRAAHPRALTRARPLSARATPAGDVVSMAIAALIGPAADCSIFPPMNGTFALSSASSSSSVRVPDGTSRSVPLSVSGAPLTWRSTADSREPSAAGPDHSCTSMTVSRSPTNDRAKSGRPSDGRSRVVLTRSPARPGPMSTLKRPSVVGGGGALGLLEGPVGEEGMDLVDRSRQLLARRHSHGHVLSLVGPAILSPLAQPVGHPRQSGRRLPKHREHPVAPAPVLSQDEVELTLQRPTSPRPATGRGRHPPTP